MTRWTYDETVINGRVIPLVDIYLTEDERQVRTIDLQGAHVFIDVDALSGDVVSVEIIGPAVFTDLRNLAEYLREPDSKLKAAADELTKLGEEKQ